MKENGVIGKIWSGKKWFRLSYSLVISTKSIVIINFSSSKVNKCIYHKIKYKRTHNISTTTSSPYQCTRSSCGKIKTGVLFHPLGRTQSLSISIITQLERLFPCN